MTDSTDKLERLIEMLREGFITRAEFDIQKAKLMATDAGERQPSEPADALAGPTRIGTADTEPDLLVGSTRIATPEKIGSYRIISPIGRGGMGLVYRARHMLEPMSRKQGGDVALKLMHAHLAEDEDFRARFIDEANHGLVLDHPGIVKVHEVLIDGDQLGLVMGLCEGDTLAERSAGRAMALSEVVDILTPIAEALDYVHAQNIVHRDLKPENIKFDAQNRPIILDFGIAKDTDGDSKTQTGMGMGTVAYMAPEQYTDAKRVGPASDQYALAIMTYELLAGRLPWREGESGFNILTRKVSGNLAPLTQDGAKISDPVIAAITRSSMPDPSQRFESCMSFIDALQEYSAPRIEDEHEKGPIQHPQNKLSKHDSSESVPNKNQPMDPVQKRSKLPLLVLVGGIASITLGALILYLLNNQQKESRHLARDDDEEQEIEMLEDMRDECRTNLKDIKAAQLMHDAEMDRFYGYDSFHPDEKPGTKRREFGNAWHDISWFPDEPVRGSYRVTTTRDGEFGTDFVATCIIDVDGDGEQATYTATKTINPTRNTPDDVY